MSEPLSLPHIVQRWQQQPDEELLVETEWIAAQIAQAVEREAQEAMDAHEREAAAS